MKKLFLPFRKLSVAKTLTNPSYCIFFLVATSCSSRIQPTNELNSALPSVRNSYSSQPLISVSEPIRESWIDIRSESNPDALGVIRLNAKSCIDQKFVLGTTLQVLGVGYDMTFEEEAGQISLVLIEDSETKLPGFVIPQELKDDACAGLREASRNYVVVREKPLVSLQEKILSAIKKITPDCKSVAFDSRVARCNLETLLPQPALVRTEDFRKSMIRKWSRQPYILARRTGVVSTLAKAATNLSNEESFAKFCRVLQFSLPEELPVLMTSRRWQNALCSGQSDLRREAAFYGLAKGTQELDMLRELYEGTSRVGQLSVKIPTNVIPGRAEFASRQPLRVTITPDDEVSKRLVLEAKKYLGKSERDEHPRRLVRVKNAKRSRRNLEVAPTPKAVLEAAAPAHSDMCWHPIFGESWGLLRVSDGMKLTGDGFNLECGFIYEHDGAGDKDVAALSKYLLQSLSSETEFVLDNGQAKLLRLPEGRYKYTVHVLPANPLDSEEVDDENTPKSTGEIGWGNSRNHSIKHW